MRSGLGLRLGYGLGLRSGLGLRPRSTHLVRTADGDAKLDEHRPIRPQAQRWCNGLLAAHRHLEDVGGGEVAQGSEVLVARTDDEADFVPRKDRAEPVAFARAVLKDQGQGARRGATWLGLG